MRRVALKQRPQRAVTILDALNDRHLFQQHFKDKHTWSAWRAFLAALFALPMTDEQRALYSKHTGAVRHQREP